MGRLHPGAAELVGLIQDIFRSGGKRVRPLLVCTGFRATGGAIEGSVLRVAASVELLHTFALIHDDLMDDSDSRRGAPAVHKRAAELHPGAPEGFPMSAAILAGDLAFALSDRAFWGSGAEAEALLRAWPHVDRMRLRLAAGQYLDALGTQPVDRPLVARSKTASYTTTGPLLIGASLGNCEPALLEAFQGWGELVGEAYQLIDDLEDLEEAGVPSAPARIGRLLAAARKTIEPLSDSELHPEARVVLNDIENAMLGGFPGLGTVRFNN